MDNGRVHAQSRYPRIIQPITFSSMNGTIKSLTEKGFGFISQEGQEKDVFFHSSSLVGVTFPELHVGDAVSFEVESSEKGPRATNVQRA